MKTSIRTLLLVLAVVLIVASIPTVAFASFTTSIELETRSALLIDRSGSMDDQAAVESILGQYDITSFDEVVYFDTELSTVDTFRGGGDSNICEAIDQLADGGFTHITVVTDGEQWPADYSSLGIYTDLDLTVRLVDESEEAEELVSQLESRITNSNLKVVTPEGEEKDVLNEYQAPIYTIELPDYSENEDEGDTTNIYNNNNNSCCEGNCCKCKHGRWSWWWLLILLIPLLGLLLWWLFRNWKIARRVKNAKAVVDCSNSMTKALARLYRACRRLGVSKDAEIVRFGEGASLETLSYLKNVQGERCTHGTEGLELALAQGWDKIVLISDLGFNGKSVTSLNGRFKKVTVVVPDGYSSAILDEIKKIADEVEVLSL